MLLLLRHRHLISPLCLLFLAFALWAVQICLPDFFFRVQYCVFALGMVSVGIPHGALDHFIGSGTMETSTGVGYILRYLGLALVALLFWLVFPSASILFFLLYSAWHFGEADMQEWQPRTMRAIKNWLWGSTLLTVILCGHVRETNLILSNMSVFLLPCKESDGILVAHFLLLLAMLWSYWERRPAMFLSACILAVGTQLPLITAFGLYFIGQHSINGWSHLKQVTRAGDLSLSLKALPFTIGALLLFGAMLYSLENNLLHAFHQHAMTAFFVFISCISFPHVVAMHFFYSRYFSKPSAIQAT